MIQKQDIRHHSDSELTDIVINDETFYLLLRSCVKRDRFEELKEEIDRYYIYSDEQLNDLQETFNDEYSEFHN